jgi:DNA-binding transcriptional ArsR family regulator
MSPRVKLPNQAPSAGPQAGHGRVKAAMLRSSAQIFAALGDETRLRLIAVLCAGSAMSIAQLTAGTEMTRQSITQHLQVLANAGLVRDVKAGRERLWAFEPAHLDEARRALEAISQQWDQALLRLKAAVEED